MVQDVNTRLWSPTPKLRNFVSQETGKVQDNKTLTSKFLVYPKQSVVQHSWGNSLLRPLPFTFCSPRHTPKTPQNSRLILLPSEEEKTRWRVCLTSLSHRHRPNLHLVLANWSISSSSRIIKQTTKGLFWFWDHVRQRVISSTCPTKWVCILQLV